MASILITGGTGNIGSQLVELLLAKGNQLMVVTRNKEAKQSSNPNLTYVEWNLKENWIEKEAIEKADVIFHLAGAGVADQRWTKQRKQEILNSRTRSSALLVNAVKSIPNQIKLVVSSSAIGWYGPDANGADLCKAASSIPPSAHASSNTGFTEDAPAYDDYLGTTCKAWENSVDPFQEMGIRLVKFRTGIVLSNRGGAFVEFSKPLPFRVAAILGSGNQIISWIHVADLCQLFLFAMEQSSLAGVYNAVAPNPVSNKTLVLTLAREKFGNQFLPMPVPSFILKCLLGEMSIEVLKSTHVSAAKIQAAGYSFSFPTIESAIHQLVSK